MTQYVRNRLKVISMAEELYTNKIIPHKTNILWGLIVLFFVGVTAGLTVFSLNKTYAADETCYWVGANSNWNEATNWSSLSGGDPVTNPCAGTGGKPDSGTAVIFNSTDTTTVSPEVDITIDSLDLQTGYGTFDNATNDRSLTVANNVTMDNTQTDMGDATWTVSGSFDNYSVTTFNYNLSTLVMNGSGKEITSGGDAKKVRNFTVSSGASISISSGSGSIYSAGKTQIDGTLTIPLSKTYAIYQGTPQLAVSSTGSIIGDGTLGLNESTQITEKAGPISVAKMYMYNNTGNGYIIPATYETADFRIIKSWAVAETFKFGSGDYTFNGNVIFDNTNATGALTIDNASNNPNFSIKGNVTISESAGSVTYTKGNGTITFSGTGAQSVNFLDKTVEDIRDSNTANTVTLTDGVITDGLTVDASATFNLAGQSFNYSAATGTTNNGTIKLQGIETLTNVSNLGTNAGTVIYNGRNVAETLTLKNFAYNNLTITDANATKATFQPTNGSTLTVNGAFTLSSGTGTFDNATNDENINVTGDVTLDNTRVDMGDATWTVSGSFDNASVTTFNKNLSTLVMDGDGKNILTNSTTTPLYNLTINNPITLSSGNLVTSGTSTINSTFTLTSGTWYPSSSADIKVSDTGIVTGSKILDIGDGASISQMEGTINVSTLKLGWNHNANIVAAEYESAAVSFESSSGTARTFTGKSGTYTFTGSVTFRNTGTSTYTINNSTNSSNWEFKGNVTLSNTGGGTLTWTKGTGTITFAGTGAQSVNFLDKTVEDIRDSNTANTVTLTDGVTTDGLTVDSGATFDIAGQNLLYAAAGSITNSGTLKLQGGETLTNIGGVSSNTGTVEYNGAGPYASLILGNSYNNLTFNGTGSWSLASDLNVAGSFAHTSGTFTPNGKTVTLNGANQTISGDTTFYNLVKNVTSAATLTFTAGSTQTVSNNLDLQGSADSSLRLRSSNSNTQWNLVQSGTAGTYTTKYLDVQDSNHTGGTTLIAVSSTNSGNNIGWSFPDRYSIKSASQTSISTEPGQTFETTITREDASGNPDSGFTGDVSMTFSGANTSSNSWQPTATDKSGQSIQFGSPTTITFTSGVATTNITTYKSETATINVTDNTYSSITPLTDTVSSPTGSISIQNPPSGYSNQTNIKLDLSISKTRGTDDSKVKLSTSENDIPFTGYSTFSSPQDFSLPSSDGYKTVYAQFQDKYGNSTAINNSQTINLDVTAPSQPSDMVISDASDIDSTTQKVYASAIYFNPSTDSVSGLKGYKVVRDGTTLIEKDGITDNDQIQLIKSSGDGSSASDVASFIDLTGQANTSYTYQISSVDNAGNVSNPSSATITLGTGKTSDTGTLTQITEFAVSFEQNTNDNTITAIVTWVTNAPATGTVYYGTSEGNLTELKDESSTSSSSDSSASPDEQNYNTGHTKTITGLAPTTNYYFKATSTDQNGNSISTSKSTTSPNIEDQRSIFEIILEKIENFFSLIWQAIKYFPSLIIKQFTHQAMDQQPNSVIAFLHAKTLENNLSLRGTPKQSYLCCHFPKGEPSARHLDNINEREISSLRDSHVVLLTDGYKDRTPQNDRIKWSSVLSNFIYNTTPHALAQVSSPTEIQGLHVVSATNESNKYIGNAIYWQGEGSFTLTRDGTTLANTTTNSYLDLTASEDTDYTYSANNITGEKETALPGGTPQITDVTVTEISVTTESANIEISWLTDNVPSTSSVKYGTVKGSYSQTVEQETYNEDHSVIVSGLDPNQTYYFQVQSTSTDNITSTSDEISYTVPEAQKAKSIFVIIYEALENAFGTFIAWLYR